MSWSESLISESLGLRAKLVDVQDEVPAICRDEPDAERRAAERFLGKERGDLIAGGVVSPETEALHGAATSRLRARSGFVGDALVVAAEQVVGQTHRIVQHRPVTSFSQSWCDRPRRHN